jgi:WD40 repeat protein/tRNA A-37 threonylcarbamoyl transferase component Bud32
MHIVCPHCRNPMEVADAATCEEVCCTSCGSSFRVERDRTTDWKPDRHRLGRFELLHTLGQGAFGTVYAARDSELDRVVALKVPRGRPDRAADLDRLLREARSVGRLRHPSIVPVYEVGQAEDLPYLVCELVQGVTLADLLSSGRPAPRGAAEWAATLAEALHYAHQSGVVHRDVKPANIMLEERRVPRLMDFGLAKREAGDVTVTTDGQVLGTPAYMSPEQAGGQSHAVDGRSDVYSLGVVLYQMLTGELPFRGTPRMLLHQVLHDEPRRPRSLDEHIPRDLETVCLKAMAKEPARRYQSAAELAEDLRRFLRGEPTRARPVAAWERAWNWARRRPAVAGLLGASALAVLALVAAVVGSFYSKRLAAERDAAELARDSAERAQRGEEEQRRQAETFLYFSRIALAEREWAANNVGRTRQLLDECPAGLRGWEWDYLRRLCHADLHTLRGHGQAVSCVAFSPDGQRLATTGYDKTLKVWDAATGKQVDARPLGEVGQCLAFSPGGEWLALTYFVPDEGQAVAVDLLDTTWQRQVSLRGHRGTVPAVVFDPAGLRVATAGSDRTLRVWDAASGRLLQAFRSDAAPFSAAAFSHDGRVLAGAVGDPADFSDVTVGLVLLWDAATWKPSRTLSGHENGVLTVAFSPDGKQLASGGRDQAVRIWDPATGQELRTLRGHTDRVTHVAYAPKGRLLASASYDGSVRVWDPAGGRLLRTLRGHTGPVQWLAFNPAGDRLASVGNDGTVKVWDPALDPDSRTLRVHTKAGTGVAFSPDGSKLAACGSDGVIKVFDTGTGRVLQAPTGHSERVWSVEFSPGGDRLLSAGQDRTARVWDAATGQELVALRGHTKWVQQATFSPDGLRVATAGGDQTVRLWDARTGRELHTLTGHTDRVMSVAFFPDGTRLASCSSDRSVRVWDAGSGKQLQLLPGHTDEVFRVAVNGDGRLVASAATDQTVRIWDPDTGQNKLTLQGHTGYVMGLAFSPDGRRLASASLDQTVKVWDLALGQELLTLRADTGGFHSVAFSADGRQLAACGFDGSVRVWDATPRAEGASAP